MSINTHLPWELEGEHLRDNQYLSKPESTAESWTQYKVFQDGALNGQCPGERERERYDTLLVSCLQCQMNHLWRGWHRASCEWRSKLTVPSVLNMYRGKDVSTLRAPCRTSRRSSDAREFASEGGCRCT